MSSFEQFHSGFGEIITNQFVKCIEFSGDLDVTFDEYSEKLLDSLANIHGKNVINETENRMEDHINEIYNNDLYLSIGLCKGNETAWVVFDQRFSAKIKQYALYYTKNEVLADQINLGLKGSLFLESPKTGKSKIASYNGRGSLQSWLKVVIFRDVLSTQESEKKISSLDSVVFGIEDESVAQDDMLNLEEIVTAGFKQLNEEKKLLLREYFILRRRETDLANQLQVHVSTISRRIKNICNELLQHFTTIADEKFDLDKDQFKELLNQFDQSWHTSVAKILG